LLTSNAPLQIGKCAPGVHVPQFENPVLERQYRHFRASALLFSLVTVGGGKLQLD